MANQQRRKERMAAGLCIDCDAPATNGKRCEHHAKVMAQHAAKYRAQRKATGVCTVCREPSPDHVRCERCRKASYQSAVRVTEQNVAAGLCRGCGKSPPEFDSYCGQCRDKNLASQERHKDKSRAAGKCFNCGGDSGGKLRCLGCNEKAQAASRAKKQRCHEAGICETCGQDECLKDVDGQMLSVLCPLCYLKRLARTTLGSADKHQVLLDKLYRQDWRCYYTGDKLVLGKNLSFDHLDPVKRFPEKQNDPCNVVPVDFFVNLMKRDLTEAEFWLIIDKMVANRQRVQEPSEEAAD